MRNEVWKAGLVVFAAVSLIMLPLLGGCATTEETTPSGKPVAPPSTEKPAIPEGAKIKIGEFADLSGPYASQGVWDRPYHQAYVDCLNSKGGIEGIPVEILWVDTRLEIPKATSALTRWNDEGVCCFQTTYSPIAEGLKPACERVQIPLITQAGPYKALFPPGWIYSLRASYGEECAAFLQWLKENWKENRPPRVGWLIFDTVTGRSIDSPELWDFAKQLGIDVHMPIEYLDVKATSAMPNLKRLEEAEVDWVWAMHFGAGTAIILNDAERLGIREQIGMCGPAWSLDPRLWELGRENAIGYKFVTPFASYDDPALDEWKEWAIKIKPPQFNRGAPDWQEMMLVCDAAEIALEKEGWPITGAAVNRALQGMKDHDMRGLMGNVTFGQDRRIASYKVNIIELGGHWEKYEDRKFIPVTDWFEAPQLIGKEYFVK